MDMGVASLTALRVGEGRGTDLSGNKYTNYTHILFVFSSLAMFENIFELYW